MKRTYILRRVAIIATILLPAATVVVAAVRLNYHNRPKQLLAIAIITTITSLAGLAWAAVISEEDTEKNCFIIE